ncbi:MAG: dihydrodipicolinate synthase family protein [Candidatus Tumulicola sp.]
MGNADTRRLQGVWAAVVTPIDASYAPDAAKAIPYYGDLLATGCDGVNLFGTTGEAMSFGAGQRCAMMETVARSGLPMDRIMVGTGAASLDDAATVFRQAVELRFAGMLVMPPFFYRDAGDDGMMRFFDALFARVPAPPGRVILYNFPLMSGMTFHPDIVERLMAAFPRAIGGLKDSSNDRALQAELLARHPELAVFPGSEHYLGDAVAGGGAGCISGSVALWPELAQRVYLRGLPDDVRLLAARRATLTGLPFIPTVRHGIAAQRGDESWRIPVPPLSALTPAGRTEFERRISGLRGSAAAQVIARAPESPAFER